MALILATTIDDTSRALPICFLIEQQRSFYGSENLLE